MSLIDTIKGAAEEASANEKASKTTKDKSSDKKSGEGATKRNMRGSAASAKPKRELSGTVREASAPKKELTKEEKKAERAKQREKDDLRASVTQILLAQDADYKRTEHIWWGLIGGGFVCTLISAIINYNLAPGDASGRWAIVGVVLIALAYILIIGSFIYGMVTRSKKRKPIEMRVATMTDKKLWQIVEKDAAEKAAAKAEKEAAKAAKKAAKEAKKADASGADDAAGAADAK